MKDKNIYFVLHILFTILAFIGIAILKIYFPLCPMDETQCCMTSGIIATMTLISVLMAIVCIIFYAYIIHRIYRTKKVKCNDG